MTSVFEELNIYGDVSPFGSADEHEYIDNVREYEINSANGFPQLGADSEVALSDRPTEEGRAAEPSLGALAEGGKTAEPGEITETTNGQHRGVTSKDGGPDDAKKRRRVRRKRNNRRQVTHTGKHGPEPRCQSGRPRAQPQSSFAPFSTNTNGNANRFENIARSQQAVRVAGALHSMSVGNFLGMGAELRNFIVNGQFGPDSLAICALRLRCLLDEILWLPDVARYFEPRDTH